MARPRVLHLITRLTMGGSSENTVLTMQALAEAGYDGVLAAGVAESEPATVESARRRGCRVVDVPSLRREIALVRDLTSLRQIRRLIAATRPAIVHTHTSKAGFLGRLAARLARVPAVIHEPHGHVFYGYGGRARSHVHARLEQLAARWSDRIVALTTLEVEEHLDRGIGRRGQYRVVPSGVPTAELRARLPEVASVRAALGVPRSALLFVGVGRLVPVKGFDLLVAALPQIAARVPSVQVILVGDGPERDALSAAAAAGGVASCFRIAGAVDDVVPYLAAADVLVAPSRNEGMGRAIVEAMALGLPVVAAAAGGIPEVLGDDQGGRLVPVDNVAALADALVELGRDASLRVKLGETAMRRAERFSTRVAAERMVDVYDELAREKGLR